MNDRDEWDYGSFKVGDVVEGFGFTVHVKMNGMQILIESPLGRYEDAPTARLALIFVWMKKKRTNNE